MKAPLLLLCFATLPLAGCAVGPDYVTPALTLPTAWSGDRHTRPKPPALSHWWRNLKDPLLDDLIADAVDGNLDVAAAKARIREARATRQQAVGALFPAITGSGSATGNRTAASSSGGFDVSPTTYGQYQAGFDASWELDLFGANRRAVEAATDGVDAADDDLRATLLTLVGDVASYYIDARGYQARAALARRTAASQRQTAALTERKLAAGSASAVDSEKASSSRSSTTWSSAPSSP